MSDVLIAEGDFEGGGVVALAVAGFAVDPRGWQEVHFEFYAAVAFALGAASTLGIEGEAGGFEAAHAGLGELGEEGADVIEEFDVGGWAGAGCLSDGRLIDLIAGFDGFVAGDFFIGRFRVLSAVIDCGYSEALVHEGGFSGAGDAGQHGEPAERDGGGNVFEIVGGATC